MCVLALASCGEETLGSELDELKDKIQTSVIAEITLNMYVIVGEGTTENAIATVQNMINQYTELEYKVTLNMNYLTADEYYETVMADINASKGESPAKIADIVLVTGEDMMLELYEAGAIADLTTFFDSKAYGTLNRTITESLLDASLIDGKHFSVPNNRVLGNYEYLIVKKSVAENLNFGPLTVGEYKSLDDAADLIAAMTANGVSVEDNIKYITDGMYEDKTAYEADGWICNIAKYPTVDSKMAHSSAFVITSYSKYPARAFEILFELNSNQYFRNLIQYGVKETNYTIHDGNVERFLDGDNAYNMNLLYTGNLFAAYYCEELGWTKDVATNGNNQNEESSVFVPEETPALPEGSEGEGTEGGSEEE
jgi:hypothetical protein